MITIISFLNGLSGTLLYSLSAPLAKKLGMSPIEYASATSLFLLFSTISSPLWGRVVDRAGVKKPLLVSQTLAALSPLPLLAYTKPSLYLSEALSGLAAGCYPAFFAYVAKSYRNPERGFGNLSASGLLGGALGGLLAAGTPNLGAAIVLAALASFAALISSFALKDVRASIGKIEFKGTVKSIVFFEAVLGLGAGAAVWNFDYYLVLKYGAGLKSIGALHFLQSVLQALGSWLSPRLAEALGTERAYFTLTVPASFMLLLISLANSFAVAYMLFILRTAMMNAANPLLQALLAKACPEAPGTASAAAQAAWNVAVFVGKNLGGYMMTANLEAPLKFAFLDYEAALIFLYFSLKKNFNEG